MKKYLLAFILLPLLLQASQLSYEAKIYRLTASVLFPNKKIIYVWTDSDKNSKVLRQIPTVKQVEEIEKADILFVTHRTDISSKTMKFVTSYKLLKRYKASAIGGFYWKKGRPNILFLDSSVKKYNVKLPESMHKYIEYKL